MGMKNILHLFSISRAFSVHTVFCFILWPRRFMSKSRGKGISAQRKLCHLDWTWGVSRDSSGAWRTQRDGFALLKKNQFFRLTYKMNVRKLIFIHVIEEAI